MHEVRLDAGSHPALPFLLLDRALQVQRHLENLSHANRGGPDTPTEVKSLTADWDDDRVREINKLLDAVRKGRKNRENARDALATRLELILEQQAPL